MERYFYEYSETLGRYTVRDRKRGTVDKYTHPSRRALCVCDDRDDAEKITDALNATVQNES